VTEQDVSSKEDKLGVKDDVAKDGISMKAEDKSESFGKAI